MAREVFDPATATLDELHKKLKKLDTCECSVELALTLNESPEVEDLLTRLVTCVVQLRDFTRVIRTEIVRSSPTLREAELLKLSAKRKYLNDKLGNLPNDDRGAKLRGIYEIALKECLVEEELAGMPPIIKKLRGSFDTIHGTLIKLCKEWNTEFTKYSLFEFVPGLSEFVKPGDLI